MTSPLNNLTDTWNNGATVFTGLKYNITNTASAAGSLLCDFQVGGVSQFNVSKAGYLSIAGFAINVAGSTPGTSGTLAYSFDFGSKWEFFGPVVFRNQFGILDQVYMETDGANIFAQRNSTSAQTLRVYNTYTDASNYERGVFDWTTTSNVLRIGAQAAGTGTLRIVFLDSGSQFSVLNSGSETFRTTPTAVSTVQSSTGLLRLSSNEDVSISRSAAGVIQFGDSSANANATILAKTKAGAFAAGDIPSGTWALCRDTSGATTKLIYNNAGTLMTVALT